MLKGKTAIITGSTSGIGLGIARALADQGVNVVINGFGDAAEIEKIRQELEGKGVAAVYDAADMTKPDQIVAMVEKTVQRFGAVDILINNAGIQKVAPIEEFPPEKWDDIIAIDLSSSFHTIRKSVHSMREKKWGRIINIASAHAMVASPFKAAYVAAKHGVFGLTKVVALETAQDGITCNAICPGYTYTPLVENQIADTAKARGMTPEEVVKNVLLAAQWTKQFTTIDQIAETVLFLCSDAAANITGVALPLDGGWTSA